MKSSRIVVARTDKLGDVLLSLSSLESLRRALPKSEIVWIVRNSLQEVVSPFCIANRIWVTSEVGFKGVDVFIAQFCDVMTAVNAVLFVVPLRVGRFSKPWSFLLFNVGKRQRRGKTGRHESVYTQELVDLALEKLEVKPLAPEPICLPVVKAKERKALAALEALGIEPGEAFGVVHPGMAGSALNLSPAQYLEGILELEQSSGAKVILSQGPLEADAQVCEAILKAHPVPVLKGVSLGELAEVFRLSQWVLAPSTGPLHLAHLVGTLAIGIYSPLRSQHPDRWAPRGGVKPAFVYVPKIQGDKGAEFFCMEKSDWAGLISEAIKG